MIVWYEMTLFGVSVNILSNVFFPSESHYSSTTKFLVTIAVGFGFRPIGALIFGYVSDRYGRKKMLLLSVILVSIPSTIIGIIPSYKEIGILSPVLLVFCRIIQGTAAGGELGINSAFLIESSKSKKNLGFLGSLKAFSGGLGSVLCFIMISICQNFTNENYEIWGWRLLFYFCFFMGIIGFLMRYIMEESLAYKTHKTRGDLSNSPFLELIKDHKRAFILSIGLGIAQNSIVYSVIMSYNIYIKELILFGFDIKNLLRIIVDIIFGIFAVLFATLSDKIGRKNVMIPVLIILIFISLPVFLVMHSNNHYIIIFTYMLFSIPIAASFGVYNAIISELFPTKVRCTGFSLANNISAGVFGGISPYICMWLIKQTGTEFSSGIYLVICALISFISILQIKPQDKKIDW